MVIINPPYAENGAIGAKGAGKASVANDNKTYQKDTDDRGRASHELFAQFLISISAEIPDTILGVFSRLKYINSQNFIKFRNHFKADFKAGFVVPGDTFDNLKGGFAIGFLIWDLKIRQKLKKLLTM